MRRHNAIVTAAVLFGLAGIAPASPEAPPATASAPVLNRFCPVMPEEEADPAMTLVYKGRTIAFCCDTCLGKFRNNPERYIGRLDALGTMPAAAGHDEGDEDHGTADDHGPDDEHDEAGGNLAHEHDEQNRPPLLARIHPVLSHFPLAGLPMAWIAWVLGLRSGRDAWRMADVVPLSVAALASVAAVITGNIAHDSMRFGASLHNYVHWHQYAGTTLMVLTLLLAGLRLWRWTRLEGRWMMAYGAGLTVACLLSVVTGYLGGSLVFGPDHLLP